MLSVSTLTAIAVAVGIEYLLIGVWDLLAPRSAARFLGFSAPKEADNDPVPTLVPMLGARDLTIGAALVVLAHDGATHALGVVVLCASALNFVDAVAVGRRSGWGILPHPTLTAAAVAAGVVYLVRGIWEIVEPASAARALLGLLLPPTNNQNTDPVPALVSIIGAHDLTIGILILFFAYAGQPMALGTVLVCTLPCNYLDAGAVDRHRSPRGRTAWWLFAMALLYVGFSLLIASA
ncbi:hypothetical protein Q8F55_003326 [Vanrija albida]|uniref:Uncharacterized protein n=1 Tax=Vanrija albida TaxID=181172 RepID=A0ABR3Q3N4_9TREE